MKWVKGVFSVVKGTRRGVDNPPIFRNGVLKKGKGRGRGNFILEQTLYAQRGE